MTEFTPEFSSTKAMAYVYRGYNPTTGESYIGYHMANVKNNIPSSSDLGVVYFTSSKIVKPRFNEFNWTIVAEFFDSDDAYDFEQLLIFENWKLPGSLNKHCTHAKARWCTNGPTTGSNAKGVLKTGMGAKGIPNTGNRAKGVPHTGKKAKGMPASGLYAKGMPRPPMTGKGAKGVPNTGNNAMGVPKPKHECPHCGIWVSAGNLAKWHSDKCKLKP